MSEVYEALGRKIVHDRYTNFLTALEEIGSENFASESDVIMVRNALPFPEHKPSRAGEIADVRSIWETYGWVKGMRFYAPGHENPALYLRNSLLLDPELAENAVKKNSRGLFFDMPLDTYHEQLEIAMIERELLPEERSVMVLPTRNTFPISRSQNFDVMRFAAQSQKEAEKYFDRLGEKNKDIIMFFSAGPGVIDKPKQKPFVLQSILSGLRSHSAFIAHHNGALASKSGASSIYIDGLKISNP